MGGGSRWGVLVGVGAFAVLFKDHAASSSKKFCPSSSPRLGVAGL